MSEIVGGGRLFQNQDEVFWYGQPCHAYEEDEVRMMMILYITIGEHTCRSRRVGVKNRLLRVVRRTEK